MTKPVNGTYRHYKGPLYDVLGLARHSETEEWLVVYRPQYGERGLWVRPLDMFTGQVIHNGRSVPRFEYMDTAANVDIDNLDIRD